MEEKWTLKQVQGDEGRGRRARGGDCGGWDAGEVGEGAEELYGAVPDAFVEAVRASDPPLTGRMASI